MTPIICVSKKLIKSGHRDQVVPFLVNVLEQTDKLGLFYELKLGKLFYWHFAEMDMAKTSVKNVNKKYPGIVDFEVPDDFPNKAEIKLIDNAELTKRTREALLLGSPERQLAVAFEDKSLLLDYIQEFKPILNWIAIESTLVPKDTDYIDKLISALVFICFFSSLILL